MDEEGQFMGYSMSREKKRARIRLLRNVVAVLFVLCAILLIADIICMIILISGKGKSKDTATDITTTSATFPARDRMHLPIRLPILPHSPAESK